jgi:hypothetical protein
MDAMGLIYLILVIALIGLCIWLIETYIPMDPMFKTIIRIVVVVIAIVWLISWIGPMLGGGHFGPLTR